ncbi:MAG: hypothetical protein ACLUVG_08500 [Phocaeicola vulgatus]
MSKLIKATTIVMEEDANVLGDVIVTLGYQTVFRNGQRVPSVRCVASSCKQAEFRFEEMLDGRSNRWCSAGQKEISPFAVSLR